MGGGGGILSPVTDTLFGKPQTVATPDYMSGANQTAANNLKMAQAALAANRVSQETPYGSLKYTQTGTDSQGNPMWTATQGTNDQTQGLINTSLSNLQSSLNNPMYGINPGENMTDSIMRRLGPQIAMQTKQFDAKMANQGIPVGSEAYNNAKREFDQQQNDLMTSAVISGTNTGLQAQQLQNAQAANVKNLATPNYVNAPQQATTAGADIMGAMGLTNQSEQANANAANARSNAMMSGLFSLGGAALMSPKGTFT
jgi:hypothetical protein